MYYAFWYGWLQGRNYLFSVTRKLGGQAAYKFSHWLPWVLKEQLPSHSKKQRCSRAICEVGSLFPRIQPCGIYMKVCMKGECGCRMSLAKSSLNPLDKCRLRSLFILLFQYDHNHLCYVTHLTPTIASELQAAVGSSWESVLSWPKSVHSCVETWGLQLATNIVMKVPPHLFCWSPSSCSSWDSQSGHTAEQKVTLRAYQMPPQPGGRRAPWWDCLQIFLPRLSVSYVYCRGQQVRH